MMILEVTADQIADLTDTDLRTLVAYLCEREVRAHGYSPSAVTWGGHQNAADGGIDVRIALSAGTAISGYVPKPATGFQVKAQDMPHGAILKEMAPGGIVLPSIAELAANGGAYIIVSSKGSLADSSMTDRKAAMAEAVKSLSSALSLDFYDRRRLASWLNQHPGLVPWVRERLGLPLSGWRPFEDWSSSPAAVDAPYLLDAQTRLVGPSIKGPSGVDAEKAVAMLRHTLSKPKGVVRLVGLSGVGKTRLIQALFDNRVGTDALPHSDALYTDISDNPDPVPQEMLSRLISMGHRVVLIVDNCGVGLHKKLAAKLASSPQCLVSVITVEYDINDDELQNTEVFTLEPASPDLIEKLLENRYPAIGPPSRHTIATFSEGNSRVAFALAETAKNGESLASLNDTDLFERLFHQQKTPSADLLDAGKACALLYSFDGETLEGNDSELGPLAKLAGQTVEQLYKHVAELYRRHLVQKRSKWRAVLPHALANRLAKRALADIAPQRIEDAIVNGSSARMLRSFSRRLGYLHDDERAIALAGKWFSAGGLLAQLGKLNTLGEEVFENIAPVNPPGTLAYIEEAATTNAGSFFGAQNTNRVQIIRVLRSLAYDPALFERSATLLKRFVLSEVPGPDDAATDSLKSLFGLYLSGTHATAAQRAAFVQTLLESSVASEQEFGLELLGEMLKASHFTSSHSFEFGARKRDYGFHPEHGDQVRDWFKRVIETGRVAEASGKISSARVRHVMANHVAQLLQTEMFDEVIALANAFAKQGGWPEGWIGVRTALREGKSTIPAAALKKLEELEEHLRPREIVGLIRSYVLSPEWGALDIADVDEKEDSKLLEAREKVHDSCIDLGQQLARDPDQFDSMLTEIIASESQKTLFLGRGLGMGCASVTECWTRLRDEFLKIPENKPGAQLLGGFLQSAMARAPEETEALLDEALVDERLHPYLLYWQLNAGISGDAFKRMMKMIALPTVPVSTFRHLALGRAHEGLDDDQLHAILQATMGREGGDLVAAEILGMRVFGRRADKLPISESLKTTGRDFLAKVQPARGAARLDHLLGQVINVAFDKPEHEPQVRAFCIRILAAFKLRKVYAPDLGEIITALTKTFPRTVLDIFVDQEIGKGRIGGSIFKDMIGVRASPLDAIPEDVWMAWAAEKPETRYELLARVMRFSRAGDGKLPIGWFPAATKLIEVAPEPRKVLDTFLQRFRPNGWSGSLADTLAAMTPLIETLKTHTKAEIAAWANERAPAFAAHIEQERAQEAAEYRARDQAFE
jgi:hypothetical protein